MISHDLSLRGARHPGYATGGDVWLLRHAQVHERFEGIAYGSLDVPLSAQGEIETAETARRFARLPLRAVLSSTLARARALGEALASASGAPLIASRELREIDRGVWQGMAVPELLETRPDEVAAFYADPWSWNGHGGETDRDVLARAWPALESALAQRGPPIAVATHYNVIRALLGRALGLDPAATFRLRVDLGGACLLCDTDAGWELRRLNVRSPID
ncbi:MAG TPA: histidine phosphatase family protein [Planctomycetota bacterium]|nr:histidine phosphatase family protein [Planctomycetota bacterium]